MDETLYLVLYPIFLISVPIYFLLSRKERKTKRNVKWCLVLVILTLIGLEAVEAFTIKPSRISGNGNPAILVILANIPYFVGFHISFGVLCSGWIRWITDKKRGWICGAAGVCFVFFLWLSIVHAQRIYEELSIHHELIVYNGWNQYTNTVFINHYTFLTTIMLNIIFVILVQRQAKKEQA